MGLKSITNKIGVKSAIKCQIHKLKVRGGGGGAVPFVHLAVELEKLPVLGMKDFCKITTISILFCFNAKCNKCFLLGCLEENSQSY